MIALSLRSGTDLPALPDQLAAALAVGEEHGARVVGAYCQVSGPLTPPRRTQLRTLFGTAQDQGLSIGAVFEGTHESDADFLRALAQEHGCTFSTDRAGVHRMAWNAPREQ